MKVTFVLPGYVSHPIGGYRVVYEYASRLQARGHRISVLHPYAWEPQSRLGGRLWARRWIAIRRLADRPLASWFPHHPGVRLRLVPDLRDRFIPDGDAVFATGWQTAPWVSRCSDRHGHKYYLIQHYETWAGAKEEVDATWRLPLDKIVIARWLEDLAATFGEADRTTYIPNGLDLDAFRLRVSIEARAPLRVGMLYHPTPWKGALDGIAALERVRKAYPGLEVVFFGTRPRAQEIPKWATYVQNPPQPALVDLYNSCTIFLHTSWTEGWGLPAAEAMACGCALVAAANEGVKDFATHGETALMAPIKDPNALAEQVLRLLSDDDLRQRLADAGHRRMQAFTWDRSVDRLERVLTGAADECRPLVSNQ